MCLILNIVTLQPAISPVFPELWLNIAYFRQLDNGFSANVSTVISNQIPILLLFLQIENS